MDALTLRVRALEATLADLSRERRDDRILLKELLAQILALTDKQTQLLSQFTELYARRAASLQISGTPVSYTYTEAEEYRNYLKKNHPELLEAESEPAYNVKAGEPD